MITWPGIGNNNKSIIVKIVLFTCNVNVFSYKVNFIVQSLLLARLHLRDRSFSLRLVLGAEVGEAGCQSLSFCARYFLAFLAKNPKNFFAYFVQFLTFCFLFISTKVQSIEHVTSIPHSECLTSNRKATLLSCMTIFDILRLQLRDDQLEGTLKMSDPFQICT